jgi:hypothetical protein
MIPLFGLLRRFFIYYELVFDLDNKKVELRHMFFYNSLYEKTLEKCKFVIFREKGLFTGKYVYRLMALKSKENIFSIKLKGVKSAQRIKNSLNQLGYDIKIVEYKFVD